jgi:hypothetical protein
MDARQITHAANRNFYPRRRWIRIPGIAALQIQAVAGQTGGGSDRHSVNTRVRMDSASGLVSLYGSLVLREPGSNAEMPV